MPTPHQQGPSANGASHANLFVEADPDHEAFESRRSQRRRRQAPAPPLPRGEGAVWSSRSTPLAPPLSAARMPPGSPARTGGSAGLPAVARQRHAAGGRSRRRAAAARGSPALRGACRGRAARRGAARPQLAWAGAARRLHRDATPPSDAQITAAAALRRDQARIDELTAQLGRAERTRRRRQQASAAAATAWRIRAQNAERKLTLARHRRRR